MTISRGITVLHHLDRPDGRLAYDLSGEGPLVICLPGMGDIRTTYRFLAPALTDAGFRVATLDLRGHGDSDATFSSYDDEAAASDVIALAAELGGPAIVVGNSMGAGAAVIAAARRPDLVSGLVLVGPFVRNPAGGRAKQVLFGVLMAPLWARLVWRAYLPTLYAGRRPDDFGAHREAIVTALKKPGHTRAFSRTTHTTHAPAEALIGEVKAPALILMGALDPDFPDPRAEADWIADQLGKSGSESDGGGDSGGDVVMVEDAGHYPQSQRPDIVGPAVVAFARRIRSGA